jgi:acetyl-CoA carboxylase carboxyltransferase component
MGGARMHCSVSGCGDVLCKTEEEAIREARRYFAFFPRSFRELPPVAAPRAPRIDPERIPDIVPLDQNRAFDILQLVEALVDEGSFFEVKKLYAGELVTGLARIEGRPVGIVANQPKVKGGVLFVESADKAARFIWLCDAFNIPLLYLSDVPGFMIGTKVERAGIIRAGAKMISAVSEATVPRICVVVRKAYGAGLYAMDGPGFAPSATLALPQAMIAVMGPEAAVNAVFFNKIQERPEAERAAYVQALRDEYKRDIDIELLASELIVDAVVPGRELRHELARRFHYHSLGYEPPATRKRAVLPV